MSIASYQRNERLGVTGPHKPTCLPATIEQISPEQLRSSTYPSYEEFVQSDVWKESGKRDYGQLLKTLTTKF